MPTRATHGDTSTFGPLSALPAPLDGAFNPLLILDAEADTANHGRSPVLFDTNSTI
jgi:hypothetical protein